MINLGKDLIYKTITKKVYMQAFIIVVIKLSRVNQKYWFTVKDIIMVLKKQFKVQKKLFLRCYKYVLQYENYH